VDKNYSHESENTEHRAKNRWELGAGSLGAVGAKKSVKMIPHGLQR
jgi:hypothetical protein